MYYISELFIVSFAVVFVSNFDYATMSDKHSGLGLVLISNNKPDPLGNHQGDTLIFNSGCGTSIIKDGGKKGKSILAIPQCKKIIKKKKEIEYVPIKVPVKEPVYIPMPVSKPQPQPIYIQMKAPPQPMMKMDMGSFGGMGGMDMHSMGGMGGMDSMEMPMHMDMDMGSMGGYHGGGMMGTKKSVVHMLPDEETVRPPVRQSKPKPKRTAAVKVINTDKRSKNVTKSM